MHWATRGEEAEQIRQPSACLNVAMQALQRCHSPLFPPKCTLLGVRPHSGLHKANGTYAVETRLVNGNAHRNKYRERRLRADPDVMYTCACMLLMVCFPRNARCTTKVV